MRLGEARFDSMQFDERDPSHRSDGAHADARTAIGSREKPAADQSRVEKSGLTVGQGVVR